jgi:hypothetical protein
VRHGSQAIEPGEACHRRNVTLRACYPAPVTQRWTALLVAVCCAASPPALASQAAPAEAQADPARAAEDRGQALYAEGKYREAGDALVEAYGLLPNDAAHRTRRNAAVSQAINAYKDAFDADPSQCEVAIKGLELIDQYIKELRALFGAGTEATFEFQGMTKSREDLGQAKAARSCPDPTVKPEPPVAASPAAPEPKPVTLPPPRRSHARAFGVGLGLSAGIAIGMAIGGGVMFTRLRKPEGPLYVEVVDAADAAGVSTDRDTNMCAAGMSSPRLDEACKAWQGGYKGFVAMTVLAGVFTASTAVFAGLLIRDRQRQRPVAQAWRRHEVQLGAAPRIGGAAVTAGFRF